MHGCENPQIELFCYAPLENMIPADHPLREIRKLCDLALRPIVPVLKSRYSGVGQEGVPPAILLRALLLQALYSIRSERSLCEQIEFNYLFRWFVGLKLDERVFDHSVFSKNRSRLMGGGLAESFFGEVVRIAQSRRLLASDRLVVDGTQIKAWASMKSFKAKDGSEDDKPNFKGTKRSNETHSSKTDPEARLYRKGPGQESMLCHMGHVLVDGVTGIVKSFLLTPATGTAEVESALSMARTHMKKGQSLVGDRLYDQGKFVDGARELGLKAHPRAKKKYSRLDGRTTKSKGYEASMKCRHIVERTFGWIKSPGRMRQTVFHGTEKVGWQFAILLSAMNLTRIANLTG